MDNATLILCCLDRHLDHEIQLILYGRAAIQLGFPGAPDAVARSLDRSTPSSPSAKWMHWPPTKDFGTRKTPPMRNWNPPVCTSPTFSHRTW